MKMLRTLSGIVTLAVLSCFSQSGVAQNVYGRAPIPNHVVFTQDGKAVRFFDELVKGKIVVFSFIYTSCADVCPLVTARMADLQDRLGELVGKSVFFVSVSIDPARDTPEALRKYAEAFQLKPGYTLVTGKPEEVRDIGFKLGERSRRLSEHTNDIVLANEATGEWMRDSAFSDIDRLAETVRNLDPKFRAQVRSVKATDTPAPIIIDSNRPGEVLFARMCANCHTVGRGDKIGPDLAGASERKDRAWLTRFIVSPSRVLAEKDEYALALLARYKNVRMPNLGMSENDASDLIAYIEAQTYRARGTVTGQTSAPASAPHHH